MNFKIPISKDLYRYKRQSQYSVCNPVIILYQYHDLVDLLIKKERSRMGWSLYADLQFPQSMRNTKVDEIGLGEECDKEEEKHDNKITTNDKNIVLATTLEQNLQEDIEDKK